MIITLLDIVLFTTYFILLYLAIFWLLVLISKEDERPKNLGRNPLFSVIVPAYNEEESIAQTLDSLVKLEYPKDLIDIVVVNDGSKDKTQEIVENFIHAHPSENITLLNQQNGGKGSFRQFLGFYL